MSNSFIKIYDEDEEDGYISSNSITYFDIQYISGNISYDAPWYIVRACEKEDSLEDGYIVSPRIYNKTQASLFLDSIIEKLKRF